MTGRARGRARGRGRAQQNAPPPGAAPAQTSAPAPSVGRGRARGAGPPAQAAAAPPSQPAAATRPPAVAGGNSRAPTEQMAQLAVGEERPKRKMFGESRTRRFKDPSVDKKGTGGRKVNIVSNYFQVTKLPNFSGLHQYVVSFEPDIQSIKLKGFLLFSMQDVIGEVRVFDGMTLFLPKKLADNETERGVVTRDGSSIKVKITFTNDVPENSPQVVQLMGILFRRQLKHLNMQLVGRHYFNPARKIDVPAHKMVVWPGFETSILQHEKEVLLCANTTSKILNAQSVLQWMYEIYNQVDHNRFYDVVSKKLVGQIVLTKYNNKTYTVDDIAWDKHPTDTFEKADGSKITYKEYYATAYENAPGDDQQPLLLSRPKDKDRKRGASGNIYLLPEFCSITGLSDEMRANFTVMKDLAQHTRIGPAQKVKILQDFMRDLTTQPESQKELKNWNMSFSPQLLQTQGRTLPPQPMYQRNAKFSYKDTDADWSRETRGKELISAFNMSNWVLLYSPRDEKVANDFLSTLKRVAAPMGMRVNDPHKCRLENDQARTYSNALQSQIKRETEIVVCIVPNNRKDRYDAIKKITCVDSPVPSQVIVSRTLSKQQMLMSVCTKIAIQLNCKLGGEVWATEIPVKKLMVIGFDVYHDSLNKGQSIGGFIASTNDSLTRYYSRITKQRSHNEICDQLKICMTGALKKYREVNGYDPDRILVYRDGVGDGQIFDVKDHEVPQLKRAIEEFNPAITKFAMIIVKKRISTRLFAQSQSGFSNPMPGTIVDTDVTRPEFYDFFLCSQTVRQGTVTPVNYSIIEDTSGFKPDHFQKLTYKLCHLYYNWPGTIKVPAPCQYAHKLAFLIGQSVHTDPAPELADRLYYL